MENNSRPTKDYSPVVNVLEAMSHSVVVGVFKDTGKIGFLIAAGTPPMALSLLATALQQEAAKVTELCFASPAEIATAAGLEAPPEHKDAADITGVRETLRVLQGEAPAPAPGLDGSESGGPQVVS